MDSLSYKTISVNKENAGKEWVLIDATNLVLGRMCAEVSKILRGKHKPSYTPHSDCGDNVVIINADKVRMTGKKMSDKKYIRHTGYPGGQKVATPKEVLAKKPTGLVEMAIVGMLPKSRLGREQYRNCYIYAGSEHKHEAQKPKEIKLNI